MTTAAAVTTLLVSHWGASSVLHSRVVTKADRPVLIDETEWFSGDASISDVARCDKNKILLKGKFM